MTIKTFLIVVELPEQFTKDRGALLIIVQLSEKLTRCKETILIIVTFSRAIYKIQREFLKNKKEIQSHRYNNFFYILTYTN